MDENKTVELQNDTLPQEHRLTPELEAALQQDKELREKLAEIYAQCWDDESFKQRFIEDPTAVMDEYGAKYDETKEYRIVEAGEKTLLMVLPYEGIKPTMEAVGKSFADSVADVTEVKQIIPEGWRLSFIQNTEDINYIVLPVSPENLTPEELEFVSGGCFLAFFIAATVFLVGVAVVAGAAIWAAAALAAAGVVVGEAALVAHAAIAVKVVTSVSAPTSTDSQGGLGSSGNFKDLNNSI